MNSNVEFKVDKQRIRPDKSEVFRLFCDNTKIKKMTGYKPETNMREGLKKTIEWLMIPSNLARYKSEIYNV